MDRENHAGLIVVLLLIFALFAGLFVYTHFILGEHTHQAAEDDWVVETAATCTEQGYKYQVCTTCGISFNGRVVDALGHDFADPIKENVVEATCTAGGSYDMTSYCSRCGVIDSKESFTVDVLAHTPAASVRENVQKPTCTKTGSYDSAVYCVDCGELLSKEVGIVIPVIAHSYQAISLSINEDNEPELYIECSECHLTNVITTFTAEELKRDDDYDKYPLATCDKDGLGKYELNIVFEGCNISKVFYDIVEPKYGHCLIAHDSYGKPYNILTTAWNLDAFGNEIYGVRFDKDLKREYFDVSTPGLIVVVDEHKGQTYDSVWDENGYAFASYKCSRCGVWFIVDVYNANYDSRIN